MSTETKPVSILLDKGKECKGSIRFETLKPHDAETPITNVYVSRALPWVNAATRIKITVEIVQSE